MKPSSGKKAFPFKEEKSNVKPKHFKKEKVAPKIFSVDVPISPGCNLIISGLIVPLVSSLILSLQVPQFHRRDIQHKQKRRREENSLVLSLRRTK